MLKRIVMAALAGVSIIGAGAAVPAFAASTIDEAIREQVRGSFQPATSSALPGAYYAEAQGRIYDPKDPSVFGATFTA